MRRAFSLALLLIAIVLRHLLFPAASNQLHRLRRHPRRCSPALAQTSGQRMDGSAPFRFAWTNRLPARLSAGSEIADLQKVFLLELTHDTGKDWNFYRDAAKM